MPQLVKGYSSMNYFDSLIDSVHICLLVCVREREFLMPHFTHLRCLAPLYCGKRRDCDPFPIYVPIRRSYCRVMFVDTHLRMLVCRFGLVEENAVEVFHHYSIKLSFFPFRENNDVVVFPFPFHIFISLANL